LQYVGGLHHAVENAWTPVGTSARVQAYPVGHLVGLTIGAPYRYERACQLHFVESQIFVRVYPDDFLSGRRPFCFFFTPPPPGGGPTGAAGYVPWWWVGGYPLLRYSYYISTG